MPLKAIPMKCHEFVSAKILNQLFKKELELGELDFLDNKSLLIEVRDIDFSVQFHMQNQVFIEPNKFSLVDLIMSGDCKDFLALINQQEDPDTLFFQRKLRLSGETELGLYLKNFLDASMYDNHKLPQSLQNILLKLGILLQ